MHEDTTIPFPHQPRFTEDPFTEVVRQGAGSVLDVEMNSDRSIDHMLSRVKSGGGAASLFSVAGRIHLQRREPFRCLLRPTDIFFELLQCPIN